MSTASERRPSGAAPAVPAAGAKGRNLWLAAALLALGGCLQGPWDYYPENPPVFRGIWLNGYVFHGQPVTRLCMEKLLDVSEESTDAFAFFDSATVRITGRFGDADSTLTLAQRPDAPNCFAGDTSARAVAGHAYDLVARVVWDSAGKRVVHTLTARARVPEAFSIRDSAVAPRYAATGGLPPNIFTAEFVLSLPPEVQQDSVLLGHFLAFQRLQGDTAAQNAYIRENGQAVEKRLTELLGRDQFVYPEGAELFYLSGVLNTLSHYYTSDRSQDVGGVLITHRFDSTAERPVTAFEGFFGTQPDSSEYYYEGSIRRLGMYPAVRTAKGYNLLDSIGVVNTWFHTGLNRLYFYGMEDAYVDYVQTAIEGEEDPRTKPKYNVQGGRGFFVGGVPDSFDVNIKVDAYTKAYSLPAVHAFECREDGWYSNKDCSTYYRPYCLEKGWEPADCGVDAVNASLEARLDGDTALLRAAPAAARADAEAVRLGTERFCVENGFPDLDGTCDASREACGTPGINACKESLWNHCKDTLWRPAQCGEGLAWYCRDKGRPSEVMCRQADAFCRDNPGNAACR